MVQEDEKKGARSYTIIFRERKNPLGFTVSCGDANSISPIVSSNYHQSFFLLTHYLVDVHGALSTQNKTTIGIDCALSLRTE